MADTGKQKALDTTLASLRKRFGEGTVMRLGESEHLRVEAIPTLPSGPPWMSCIALAVASWCSRAASRSSGAMGRNGWRT